MSKLVLAGNYREFLYYFRNDKTAKYITERSQMLGYRDAEFIKVGTWYKQPHDLITAFEQEEQIMNASKANE